MSAPGLRHGFDDSVGKSTSKSVERIGFPVAGWTGLPFGSILEVWRAGYSVPGRSLGGCEPPLVSPAAGVPGFIAGVGVDDDFLMLSATAGARLEGRCCCCCCLGCLNDTVSETAQRPAMHCDRLEEDNVRCRTLVFGLRLVFGVCVDYEVDVVL